jgi:hypothetical protein
MRVNYFYTLAAGFVIVVLLSLFALNSHGTARETIISVLPPISDEPAFIIGTRVLDLDGNIRRIGDEDGVRPAVLVFLSSYCTISSRYLPELNALAKTSQKANVDFYGVFSINIPPGEKNYWRHIWMKLPGGATLTHVTPHMHYLGAEVKAVATLPDGSKQPIIYIDNWDFRWQNKYSFRQPLHLPTGTRIDVWFRLDNSADNIYNLADPPERILWGWGSNEEMAEFFITLIPDNDYDRENIRKASWKSRIRRADSESGKPLSSSAPVSGQVQPTSKKTGRGQ